MKIVNLVRYTAGVTALACLGGAFYYVSVAASIPTQDHDRPYTVPNIAKRRDVVDGVERARATYASMSAIPYIPRPPALHDSPGAA